MSIKVKNAILQIVKHTNNGCDMLDELQTSVYDTELYYDGKTYAMVDINFETGLVQGYLTDEDDEPNITLQINVTLGEIETLPEV